MGKVGSINDTNLIKQDLQVLEEWSRKWQMPFNAKKCKVMHVGRKNSLTDYEINGETLERVEQEVDLGITIREDLKMEGQCSKAANKANQILRLIARTFVSRDKNIVLALYKTLVRPHLDYCIQAWRPYLIKDITKLEKVQRRATRMVEGLKDLSYEERLKRLNLTTLETRRIRADMLEVYKIFHGMEGLDGNKFFELNSDSKTRGHQFKLYKKSFRTNYGKYSFGNRVVTEWNTLTEQIVMSESINIFKKRLDHHLGHIRGFN